VRGFHQGQRQKLPHTKAGYMGATFLARQVILSCKKRGGPYATTLVVSAMYVNFILQYAVLLYSNVKFVIVQYTGSV